MAELKELFTSYYGNGYIFLLYLVSLFYIAVIDKNNRKMLVWPSVFLMVLLLNPFTYSKLADKMAGGTYWRLLWAIPTVPVIAIGASEVIVRFKKKSVRYIMVALLAAVIVVSGSCMYTNDLFQKSTNHYKLPQSVIDVASYLLSLEDEPYAVVTSDLYCYIRQYSTDIHLMYGRDMEGYVAADLVTDDAKKVNAQMASVNPDIDILAPIVLHNGYDIVVFRDDQSIDVDKMASYGFANVGYIDNYYVFQFIQ